MERLLTYIGNTVLRKKASPLTTIDASVLQLIQDMKETLLATPKAVALAAPQIGESVQLFITRHLEDDNDIASATDQIIVFINPHIDQISQDTWKEEEGCLSIPGLYRLIERPREIIMTAQDETGRIHTRTYKNWYAKILMHENDHLHGAFFIDRLSKQEKKRLGPELEKIRKKIRPLSKLQIDEKEV